MTKNKTIGNNSLDLGFVRQKRYEDFSMVPTKPYEMLLEDDAVNIKNDDLLVEDITPYEDFEIQCEVDYWPANGYFLFIDTIPISRFVLKNLELIYDIGFRIFKVDENIALVINAYGVNYEHEYFLPLYKLLVSNGVVHL